MNELVAALFLLAAADSLIGLLILAAGGSEDIALTFLGFAAFFWVSTSLAVAAWLVSGLT